MTKHLALGLALSALSFGAWSITSLNLDAGKVQAIIRDGMEKQGLTLASISCPVGASYTDGQTITCTGADDEQTQSDFKVRINGNKIDWSSAKEIVALKPIGEVLSKKLSGKLKKEVVVNCEDKTLFKKDKCQVTCNGTVDKQERLIRTLSCPAKNGDIEYKID